MPIHKIIMAMVMEETNIKRIKTLKKLVLLMETTKTVMKMKEVVKKLEQKMVKRKKSKTFCCQSDSTFTNSPNLDQSYKNTSKKPSVYEVRKRKQIQKEEEEEVHL
jgi:hypothetical protein